MKKFLKMVFSRMTIVIVAILLQIALSFILPYIFNYYFSDIFSNIFLSFDLVVNILAFIFLLYIINSNMTIEGQLVWVILALTMPVLTLIIYFYFVRNAAPKKYRQFYASVKKEVLKYQVKYKAEDEKLNQGLGKYYGQFEYIYNATGLKTYADTDTKYLSSGEEFFAELITELNKAEKYIFMEYFIIERGEFWNKILNTLKAKVDSGVEVRVMYDDLGTIHKLPSNYAKRLTKLGIKCVKFNSFVPIMSGVHNNRDHRKMTIIDGKVGFMSGLNLADEYVNIKSPYGHWKDTGIKLTGEAVKSMLLMFLQLYDVHNMKLESFGDYLPDNVSRQVEAAEPHGQDLALTPSSSDGAGYVCPYGDGPRYFIPENVAENVYLNLISQAEHYVWITTPYLIIDGKLTQALRNAAMRGVDVRIITPFTPDKKYIHTLTRSSYKNLQEAGVKIYEYSKGFIHSKQVLCDDEVAVIGTINFDYRSLLHHYECGVLMCKTPCLKDLKADFEYLFTVGYDMSSYKQSAPLRLFCAIVKLFTPML